MNQQKDQNAEMWIRTEEQTQVADGAKLDTAWDSVNVNANQKKSPNQQTHKRDRRRQRATISIRRRNSSSGAVACNHSPMSPSLGLRSHRGA